MYISYMTMNRLAEEQAAKDPEMRERMTLNGKCTLSDGRALSDDALLEKLASFGWSITRKWLDRWSREFPSAQDLSTVVLANTKQLIPDSEVDWVWISILCLWERWFPYRPNFEMLDDQMQAGYAASKQRDYVEACRHWRKAWRTVEQMMRTFDIPTLGAFDDCFGGTQFISSWAKDYAAELFCVGGKDPQKLKEGVVLCRKVLALGERTERDQSLNTVFTEKLAEFESDLGDDIPPEDWEDIDEDKLDSIIAELDSEYTGMLPIDAINAARNCPRAITPRLIALIEQATEKVRASGKRHSGDGALFALYLLTEFQAKEALPAILPVISLPGEGPFDIFSDAILDDFGRVLAVLADDPIELIGKLIGDKSLNEYVRMGVASTYLYLVRDGLLTRQEAVRMLSEQLSVAIAKEDEISATGLVSALVRYGSTECQEEIRKAFTAKVIDEEFIDLKFAEEEIAEGDARFEESLLCCRPTTRLDTIEEFKSWHAFNEEIQERVVLEEGLQHEKQEEVSSNQWADSLYEEDRQEELPAVGTIHNTDPRIGRNDPCPCGSGKKYKKCCLRQ